MSQSLFPVSGSTSTPSPFAPLFSRWNTRSVALLIGASAGLALIYAIYRGITSASSPISATPIGSRRESLDLPRVSYKAKQHSSEMTHNGKPCLDKTQRLPFDYFAEGFFKINLSNLFPVKISENTVITVRCSYEEQEFFVHRETISPLSTIEFFMPNLPYNNMIALTIDFEDEGQKATKTIDLFVEHERAIYEISSSDPSCIRLPVQTETYSHLLPNQKSIETSFDVCFTQDHQVVIQEAPLHASILIDNQSIPTLTYFKIVHHDQDDSANDIAIALPFFISESEKKTLLPSTLIELWKHAYHQATGKEVKRDLNLVLSEIKLITYPEEPLDLGSEPY